MATVRASLNKRLLAVGALALALGGAASWYLATSTGVSQHGSSVDSDRSSDAALQTLLHMSLPDSAGKSVDINQYRGQLRVINFWATWCAPCVQEMPELSELASERSTQNIPIIGIGIDSAANIAQFAGKHQISYPLLVAGGSAVQMLAPLGNSSGGLPFTLVIGQDGQIKYRHIGRLNMASLRQQLAQLAQAGQRN